MNNLFEYEKPIDIIIDFSVPANLNMICEYAINHKTPVVIATTGFNPEQKKQIKELSKIIAGWDEKILIAEQQEAIEEFQNVVDNPYPWEYIEE